MVYLEKSKSFWVQGKSLKTKYYFGVGCVLLFHVCTYTRSTQVYCVRYNCISSKRARVKHRVVADDALYRCWHGARLGRIQYYFCFWVFNLYYLDPIVHHDNIFFLRSTTLHFTLERFQSDCQTSRDVRAITRYKQNHTDPYTSIIQFRVNSLILFVPMLLLVFFLFECRVLAFLSLSLSSVLLLYLLPLPIIRYMQKNLPSRRISRFCVGSLCQYLSYTVHS